MGREGAMTRIGAAAALGLLLAGLSLAAGPAAAELPPYLMFSKSMPEAMQNANQRYQVVKTAVEYQRKEVRKWFRQAFIACRGDDACEDRAEAQRDPCSDFG